MANSHAETGAIADKAGATTEGANAENSTVATATAPAAGVGAADVAGPPAPEPPKPDANAAESGKKEKESGKKEKESDTKKAESTKKVADAAKKLVDTALDEAGKVEKPQNLKKVKMVRSHPEFAYHAGEEGELPADKAKTLIDGGFAEAVTK